MKNPKKQITDEILNQLFTKAAEIGKLERFLTAATASPESGRWVKIGKIDLGQIAKGDMFLAKDGDDQLRIIEAREADMLATYFKVAWPISSVLSISHITHIWMPK